MEAIAKSAFPQRGKVPSEAEADECAKFAVIIGFSPLCNHKRRTLIRHASRATFPISGKAYNVR